MALTTARSPWISSETETRLGRFVQGTIGQGSRQQNHAQ